jgi:hypothetical protein
VSGDGFGYSVAIAGHALVVGAPSKTQGQNMPQGAAYVFGSSGATWNEQAELTVSKGMPDDSLGYSVAISGNTVVVGALSVTTQQGAAYVFSSDGVNWTDQSQLVPGADADQGFGYSVGVSGGTAVVGDPFSTIGGSLGRGTAYVFSSNGTTWSEQAELIAGDGARDDGFGGAVGVSGNTLIVGAPFKNVGSNFQQGAAYMFSTNGTTWIQEAELTGSDGARGDEFGDAVAISGKEAVIGAYTKAVGVTDAQGTAYFVGQ